MDCNVKLKSHKDSKNLVFREIYAIYCGGFDIEVPYLVDILIDRKERIRVKRRHILMMEH